MLLYEGFRDDLVEMIEDSDPALFKNCKKTKDAVLTDKELIDRMWGIYQKNIEDYGLSASEAFQDALEEVLEIQVTGDADEPAEEMSLPRAMELLNAMIDNMIELEGGHPTRVIEPLLNLGFTATELVETFSFPGEDVADVISEM